MFDRYDIRQGPSHVAVSVTENRAPTDESVRLLREMEKAAQDKVLSAAQVVGNDFNCLVQQGFDPLNGLNQYAVIYTLNGKRHVVKYSHDALETDTEKVVEGLVDAVSRHLAVNILSTVLAMSLMSSILPIRKGGAV